MKLKRLLAFGILLCMGCTLGKRCKTSSECSDNGVCQEGVCFASQPSNPTDSGVDSGVPPTVDAGLCVESTCEAAGVGTACDTTASVPTCAVALGNLAFSSPKSSAVFGGKNALVPVALNYALPSKYIFPNYPATLAIVGSDSGVMGEASLGPKNAQGVASGYVGSVSIPDSYNGPLTLKATDSQSPAKSAQVDIVVDHEGPVLKVRAVNLPNYGNNNTDFKAPLVNEVRKDETVSIRVSSEAMDLEASKVTLSAGLATNPLIPQATRQNCPDAGSCVEFLVDVSQLPLEAFEGPLKVEAAGADVYGNEAKTVGALEAELKVTRLNWARKVLTGVQAIKATPAIGKDGVIYLGLNSVGATQSGLASVLPSGALNGLFATQGYTNDGPVVGSPVIARLGASVGEGEVVMYQLNSKNGELHAVKGSNGMNAGSCPGATNAAPSQAGLVLVEDKTASPRAVGIWDDSGNTRLVAFTAKLSGTPCSPGPATDYLGVSDPGNFISNGANIYWAQSNGRLRGAKVDLTNFISTPPSIGSGIINGLAVTKSGMELVGGGGPGVGKVFNFKADGSVGWTWPLNVSAPVSGPIVTEGDNVIAVRTSEAGTLLELTRVDSAGGGKTKSVGFGAPSSNQGASTPVAGEGGKLYSVDSKGSLFIFPQAFVEGAMPAWSQTLPTGIAGPVSASPTLACNKTRPNSNTGVLYFATESGWLVSYLVDSKGLDSTAPWPKYARDARNTGNSSLPLSTGCD